MNRAESFVLDARPRADQIEMPIITGDLLVLFKTAPGTPPQLPLAHRQQAGTASGERWTGVLVYPSTVARTHVLRMGRTLAQRLTEDGIVSDVAIVEGPSAGMLDVSLAPGKTQQSARPFGALLLPRERVSHESGGDFSFRRLWARTASTTPASKGFTCCLIVSTRKAP